MKDDDKPRLLVDRPVLTMADYQLSGVDDSTLGLDDIDEVSGAYMERLKRCFHGNCRRHCSLVQIGKSVMSLFPMINWLRNYNIKRDLLYDIVSGCTCAVLHAPHGMASALLATVPTVYGLYTSFFPVLLYSFMGTSVQLSVGTYAVLCLMTSSVIGRLDTSVPKGVGTVTSNLTNLTEAVNLTDASDVQTTPVTVITAIEVAVAITFLSGIIQTLMGVLRLGKVGVLMSPPLASGFTTGAAVHVTTSQIQYVFSLKVPRFSGPLNIIYIYISIFKNIHKTNIVSLVLSLCVIVILVVFKDFINAKFREKLKIPIPIDLIVVVLGTVVSHFLSLNSNYGVPIIGSIPTGLPPPSLPSARLLPEVAGDSVAIALVGFASSLSLAAMYAKRHNYKIDANQELLAIGAGNILGGFFSCIPSGGSLARSAVMDSIGARTQCVLASITIIALKDLLKQFTELKRLGRISKVDACIWFVTFVSVVLLDVTYGLIISVIVSLFTVVWRMQSHRGTTLQEFGSSGVYIPGPKVKCLTPANRNTGCVTVLHFGVPLFFATASRFQDEITRIIRQRLSPNALTNQDTNDPSNYNLYIVLDCSTICYIDDTGLTAMREVINKSRKEGVCLYLASLPVTFSDTMEISGIFDLIGKENVFLTVHDAVLSATTRGANQVGVLDECIHM
ncbi:prestin-like isoform X2 [Tachypleus tridentatus]|uniref:prestin-like isoform X2 n=1 Tax=Tachypleus tridentatus TaxID=6853 RepID=UPI003FD4A302